MCQTFYIVQVLVTLYIYTVCTVVPRYNGLLGGKPCPLLPIVRYKKIGFLRDFGPKNIKNGRFFQFFSDFFSENSDITDKIAKNREK